MRGFGQSTSLSLVGWLWADILLGLFALFLAANTSASAAAQPVSGIDPREIQISIPVDGRALLHGTADGVLTEQRRIADVAEKTLAARAPGREVAIVFVYGVHPDPVTGDELAKAGSAGLTTGAFTRSAVKAYHELAPLGSRMAISLVIYLFYP